MSVVFDFAKKYNPQLDSFCITKTEDDLREQVRVLKNKLAVVGKMEAKERNKIETSL